MDLWDDEVLNDLSLRYFRRVECLGTEVVLQVGEVACSLVGLVDHIRVAENGIDVRLHLIDVSVVIVLLNRPEYLFNHISLFAFFSKEYYFLGQRIITVLTSLEILEVSHGF